MSRLLTRRKFLLTASAPLILGGCDELSKSPAFRDYVLSRGEGLSQWAQRLIGRDALAREYEASDISPHFRTNGTSLPDPEEYHVHAEQEFRNWHLEVDGLVEEPGAFSLSDLRAMPSRTQITRHDCVEGWSAIAKWTGVPMSRVLDAVRLKPEARFLFFHCYDSIQGIPYYESIDLIDGFHPQTILAYGMNDETLPVGHGAPVRLRVERQLGYKQVKYIKRIEVIDDIGKMALGKGGFWEDFGNYEWYAGI